MYVPLFFLGVIVTKILPMGVSNSPENFQQKTNDLFHRFGFIRMYINELLLLSKGDWKDYVQKLELTINKKKEK